MTTHPAIYEPTLPTEAQHEVLQAIDSCLVLTEAQELIAQELRGMCLVRWGNRGRWVLTPEGKGELGI